MDVAGHVVVQGGTKFGVSVASMDLDRRVRRRATFWNAGLSTTEGQEGDDRRRRGRARAWWCAHCIFQDQALSGEVRGFIKATAMPSRECPSTPGEAAA